LNSIAFYTIAYNAEAYISKTIESVLNQVDVELIYYIRDNGSTDSTLEIINSYASKDSRMVVFHNDRNGHFETQEPFHFPKPPSDYITILDADDYVVKDYAKRMLEMSDESEADIVIGGSAAFEDGNESLLIAERRLVDAKTSETGELNFGNMATTYGQLRVFWGKLYKTDFFYENYLSWHGVEVGEIFNGFDTAVSLCLMISAHKVAISSFVGHRQRIRARSHFSSLNPKYTRAFDLIGIYELGLRMLIKYNMDTTDNIKFIQSVARGHLLDLNRLLEKGEMTPIQKANFIKEIIIDARYKEIERIIGYKGIIAQFDTTLTSLSQEISKLQELSDSFLYAYISAQNQDLPLGMRKLLILFAALSPDNPNRFGYEESFFWDSSEKIPIWFMKLGIMTRTEKETVIFDTTSLNSLIIENIEEIDLGQYKNKILDLLELGDVDDAYRINEYGLGLNPIDREFLYLKSVMCKMKQSDTELYATILMIESFYRDDKELLEEISL
jgi:glycosyltransferase involved in cell wall biosynthesis